MTLGGCTVASKVFSANRKACIIVEIVMQINIITKYFSAQLLNLQKYAFDLRQH